MDSLDIIPDSEASEDPSVILETPTSTNVSPLTDQADGIELEGSATPAVSGEESENMSTNAVVEGTVDIVHSEDLFKSMEPPEEDTPSSDLQERDITAEDENQEDPERMQEDREKDGIVEEEVEYESDVIAEEEDGIEESEDPMELEEDDDDADDEDENESVSATQLPVGRIRKIMKICVNTVDDDDTPEEVPQVHKKGKHKGKGKAAKKVSNSTASMIVTKEAIFLTTVATELFIAAVTQQSSRITAATKKKTMAVDHLKRAMSDSECFEFLQGCFQPSLIIGD